MLNIISREEYDTSTTVITTKCKQQLNALAISKLIPVFNIRNKQGGRVTLTKKREKVKYYGENGKIVSCTGRHCCRGVRTKAMQNMISIDFQFRDKNIHFKLSDRNINCVGGKELDDTHILELIKVINTLQENLNYIYTLDKKVLEKAKEEILRKCSGNLPLFVDDDHFDIDDDVLRKVLAEYVDDYDDYSELEKLMEYIIQEKPKLFDGDVLTTEKYNISNVVYSLNILKKGEKELELPLDKIALKLDEYGFHVQYHNWHQVPIVVFFRVMDDDSANFHRFEINLSGTVRQFSPTLKEEAYRFYQGLMKTIQKIIDENNYSLEMP